MIDWTDYTVVAELFARRFDREPTDDELMAFAMDGMADDIDNAREAAKELRWSA